MLVHFMVVTEQKLGQTTTPRRHHVYAGKSLRGIGYTATSLTQRMGHKMFHTPLLAELTRIGVEPAALRHQLAHTDTPITGKRAAALLRGHVEPTLSEYVAMLKFVNRVLPEWDGLPFVVLNVSPKLGLLPVPPDVSRVPNGKDVMVVIAQAREDLLRSMPPFRLTEHVSSAPVSAEAAPALLGTAARALWNAAQARGNDPRHALSEFCMRVSMEIAKRVYAAAPDQSDIQLHQRFDWVRVVQHYCRVVPNALATRYDTLARFAPDPVTPMLAIDILERLALTQLEPA